MQQEIKINGIGCQDIEHFYAENKEKSAKIEWLYEEQLKEKDEIIALLRAGKFN